MPNRAILLASALVIQFTLCTSAKSDGFDLGPELCGGIYGGLNVTFSDRIRLTDQLKKAISGIEIINKTYSYFWYDETGKFSEQKTTLRNQLVSSFQERDSPPATDIWVPVGSEEKIAEMLINEGIIKNATRMIGGCGPLDLVVLTIPHNIEITNPNIFSEYITDELILFSNQMDKTDGLSGFVKLNKTIINPIAPNYPSILFTVVSPSEITRGTTQNSTWDRFDLVFRLAKERDNRYDIEVFSYDYKKATRTKFNNRPPSKEHFKPSNGDTLADEFLIATSVTRFIAKSPQNCIAYSESFPDLANKDIFSCTGDREQLTKRGQK